MNFTLLLPLLITTIVAIVGWFAAHRLSSARDRMNKRREERIRYLIGAYRSLSKAIEHKRLYEIADEVQIAVADVQLFGTTEQIRKVQRIAHEMGHRQEASMDDLLLDLRNDLRQELKLPAVQGRIWWLRIAPKAIRGRIERMNDDSFVRMIPIIVSILALLVSLTTAWLTLFRRGRLQMTHPTIVAFGYDESYERSPKVFLRTLLFSTSKRGQIIESMFVELSQGSATHIFSFWGYGEATNLVRGSGLRVGEEGVALHHHFLLANDLHEFHFKPGRHIIRVYATTIYRRTPILLSTICLELTADESFAVDRDRRGIIFDWEPQSGAYRPHVQPRDEGEPGERALFRHRS